MNHSYSCSQTGECKGNRNCIDITDNKKLDQLDNYSLLAIFDWIDLEGLLCFAVLNSRFSELIAAHCVKQRFQIHEKAILLTNLPISNESFVITHTDIIIHRLDIMLQFLCAFGHLISHLKLDSIELVGKPENYGIIHHIDKYCSKTLTTISFWNVKDDPSTKWVNAFENIEIVHLHQLFNSTNMRFHKLFPNMRQLIFEHVALPNSLFIEQHFPHLHRISYDDTNVRPYLKRILHLNPQLRHLHLWSTADSEFFSFLNAATPNLESLHIKSYKIHHWHQATDIVHFKNLKKLSLHLVDLNDDRLPAHIPFACDHLERIELDFQVLSNQWFQFILGSKQLQEISIPQIALNHEQLTMMVERLPNFVAFKTMWDGDVGIERNGIIKLMTENNNLQKVQFFVNIDIDSDTLCAAVPHGWRLIDRKVDGFCQELSFERNRTTVINDQH